MLYSLAHHLAAWQWAEDDDPALVAARQAWDRLDVVLIVGLVTLAVVTATVCIVLLLREKTATWRRRLTAAGVVSLGCLIFSAVVGRMGVVWLIADPKEAGGPVQGTGTYWYWLIWLGGAALLAVVSIIGSFIVVGAEDL